MPTLHLAYRSPADPESAPPAPAELAAALTDLTAQVLRKRRDVTAVHLQPLGALQVWVGGADPAEAAPRPLGHFRLQIDITAGSNSQVEKAEFIAAAHELLVQALGPVHPASYVIVHELPADSWGWSGLTQAQRAARVPPAYSGSSV